MKYIEPQKAPCPICHGQAVRLQSRQHGWFWKCQGACEKFFSDDHGEIVIPAQCPECSESALERFESEVKPGTFFWRCDNCAAFHADDCGKPGKLFGLNPIEVESDLNDALNSQTVADFQAALVSNGATVAEARRRINNLYTQGWIEIGPNDHLLVTEAGRMEAEALAACIQ